MCDRTGWGAICRPAFGVNLLGKSFWSLRGPLSSGSCHSILLTPVSTPLGSFWSSSGSTANVQQVLRLWLFVCSCVCNLQLVSAIYFSRCFSALVLQVVSTLCLIIFVQYAWAWFISWIVIKKHHHNLSFSVLRIFSLNFWTQGRFTIFLHFSSPL